MNDATTAFLRAVRASFSGLAAFVLEEIRSRAWTSVTFSGARHELAFRIEGDEAEDLAGRFLTGLATRRFDLRGHILADIALLSEERSKGFARIRLEALTVEDG